MSEIIPRKTVLEYRFDGELEHLDRHVSAGKKVLEKLQTKIWGRSAELLMIVSEDASVRVGIEANRLFFDCDSVGELQKTAEVDAHETLRLVLESLEIGEVHAVGLRRWYALDKGGLSEGKILSRLCASYLTEPAMKIATSLGLSVEDLNITFDLENKLEPKKSGRLSVGPMSKGEWVQHVPYASPQDGYPKRKQVTTVIKSLPESFIFVDLDLRYASKNLAEEKLSVDSCYTWLDNLRDKGKLIPKTILSDT